ncbi:hypothetical protein D3C72_1502590 [compost metagenome]
MGHDGGCAHLSCLARHGESLALRASNRRRDRGFAINTFYRGFVDPENLGRCESVEFAGIAGCNDVVDARPCNAGVDLCRDTNIDFPACLIGCYGNAGDAVQGLAKIKCRHQLVSSR